jgi:hypothetical protein
VRGFVNSNTERLVQHDIKIKVAKELKVFDEKFKKDLQAFSSKNLQTFSLEVNDNLHRAISEYDKMIRHFIDDKLKERTHTSSSND